MASKLQKLCNYAALSYVWGDTTSRIARKNTLKALEEASSLTYYDIPDTVSDAITACKELGQDYLWVDRLCIAQDDTDSLSNREQINAMGYIYNEASFTIIDVDGTCANHGLTGVGRPRAFTQDRFTLLDVELVQALPHLNGILKQSAWMSRGWTYQEHLLSKRRLYFTERARIALAEKREASGLMAIGVWACTRAFGAIVFLAL
ncbi:uncharacterized protein K452DRAFT_341906 [Aplosporella prunicola CBS 121167]|uniref:Heterokaryon incompatibility domain-containing protein n=1 Tax=Aplosporella prunicola CBS 121167 TaxID=1176127 RepID=A0A6A6B0X3_9PEZI|nr:uncharacterized protein K452DRAFT_341906 [Aplosporella prunicola CBS 121167]KAF2136905.1 hypothetical protein K452DRAFT_341906 [Aplosporella prunicola CBS 121167]